MGNRVATLLDILSSQQFQTVILLTLGLNNQQIADLLETSDRTVCGSLSDCLVRAKCRSPSVITLKPANGDQVKTGQ